MVPLFAGKDGANQVGTTALFHPWAASKRGGSDPDVCPGCGQTTYRRALRWSGATWRRPQLGLLTCSRCGTAWTPSPVEEPEPATSESTPGPDASDAREVETWNLA